MIGPSAGPSRCAVWTIPIAERHPVARRGVRRHRQRQRAVAGEQALQGAQGEDVPRPAHERHRRHDDDEADERALDHDLAAVAIGEAAPERRQQRRERRRDAEAQARPQRDLADVADTELLEVQRQERHHQREAGEADEAGGGDGEEILAARHVRIGPSPSSICSTWMVSMKRMRAGLLCMTSELVRVPSPKKRTPFISVPSVTPVAAKMMCVARREILRRVDALERR